ncbi:KAP family P-loop NTPase fold protein [Psychrobacter alimentarius]|uniref:KAP family P-loop NTPase fold protein n=1 Tax=Psychrobacter alimentarius TaxID=261164 RepID=UPI00191B8565|nr:P-loop NTPase fold protein [Psychrobacter alimentarius]
MTDYSVMRELTFSSRDEFIRKPIAEKIVKLLDSEIDVSPMIIDGKWGTGKTEFCFKLKNLIEANNTNDYKVGYINAFQADHANEPLLTLISEIVSFYPKKSYQRKRLIKNAVPYLRLVGGIGLKAGLGFAFGRYAADIPEAFSKGMETIEEGSKELIDLSLESLIEDQAEADRSLQTLKDALNNIAADNPVILLIDELDRCRPDFAVMMLETIKHVFDVENVQIILITNAEQLKATIKHSYGSETNSHDYLYKFFKYQINLPTATKDTEGKSIENNVTYFRAVVQASNVIPEEFKNNEFVYEIPTFLDVGTLSLRNIEQIVRCVETLVVFEDNKEQSQSLIVEQILMVFLSFVYMMDKDLLKQIIKRSIHSDKFLGFTNNSRLDMTSSHVRSETLIDLSVKHLFIIIFEKIFTSSFLDLPISTIDRQSVMDHIGVSLSKYDYIDDAHCDRYIKQTINNLLLFDIVK